MTTLTYQFWILAAIVSTAPLSSFARELSQEELNCRMWQLNQAHLGIVGLGNDELVRGDTFAPVARTPALDLKQAGKNLPEFVLIRYLSTGVLDTNAAKSITCIITGAESAVIADELRKFLENDMRAAIASEVKNELSAFLSTLKSENEAEQTKTVERLLAELPRNPDLVQALKKAVKP